MKFGKLEHIDDIDFTLPVDAPINSSILTPHNDQVPIYLGATGFSMPAWKGKIYPNKARSNTFLSHYGNHFNSIEFNTTHYRLPNADTVIKWKEASPPDFKFCPKVWKTISHRKKLGTEDDSIRLFCDAIAHFEEKLGPCFLQLPPYFDIDRLPLLERLLALFPSDVEIAIEVRNATFFLPENRDRYFTTLENHGAIALITDVAGRRDVLHSRITTDKAMIRWVGNGLHPTDYTRLQSWKERVSSWSQMGIKEVYFFPHEPDNLLTPEISSYFFGLLQNDEKLTGRGPKMMNQNTQISLF